MYASPTLAGSRAGSLIAGTWASLLSLGESGYLESCREIIGATKTIEAGIRERFSTDLWILGEPLVSVIAFSTTPESGLDVYDIADEMSSLGWHLNALQDPPAVHVAVTKPISINTDGFLGDLEKAIEGVKQKMKEAEAAEALEAGKKGWFGRGGKGGKRKKGDTAALYGVAGAVPNKSVVDRMAVGFVDALYKA